MTTQQKIISKLIRERKKDEFAKRYRKFAEHKLDKMDPEKLSTKARKAAYKTETAVEDFIKDSNLESIDKGAGKAVDYAIDKAKKAGEAVGATGARIKRTGSWIKKHPVKTAAGAGAVYAAGKAVSGDDDDEAKTIRKIKAKPASERTAAERRLLRIMEED